MGKNIFIAWSGSLGLELAKALQETFLKYGDLNSFLSDDIKKGDDWFGAIKKKLGEVDYGIGCLTPGASMKPWLNFEAGYVFGRLDNFRLLLVGGEKLGPPLDRIQAADAYKQDDMVKLLQDMIGLDNARLWVGAMFPRWNEKLKSLEGRIRLEADIENTLRPILGAASLLKNTPAVSSNHCLQLVIKKSIQEMTSQLDNVRTSSYSVSADQYPYYLVALQKELDARVRAVALVDQQETFWQQDVGREILHSSHHQNERVFVFTHEADFNKNCVMVQQHANQYDVSVMSYPKLYAGFPIYTKDFAIIDSGGSKVLAIYDRMQIQKTICFSTDSKEIEKHEQAFENITKSAKRVPKNCGLDELSEIREIIFSELTRYDFRPVEMSSYISVDDYDRHEEEHSYYVEMMERMIDIFKEHRSRAQGGCQVLEVGAGTGIFTRRLAQLPNIQLTALEIDWECFKRMRYNLQREYPEAKLLNEDSRTHSEPGKFDYIFSSFSDHHIKAKDKLQYFRNIRKNLKPGGLFISGDEYLRPYKEDNEEERLQALKDYHQHIIDRALAEGHEILAQLETAAMESGINKQGDFKIPNAEYEDLLRKAGFKVGVPEKIGPKDLDIGGVYVYKAWAE